MTKCDCDDYELFKCDDCAVCTNCIYEYYMVHDSIWQEAHPADRGMLCVGCLEFRRGKLLTKEDFTDAPVNSIWGVVGSPRLRNRLQK